MKEDWLVNTADPTPVFSLLVTVTYAYLHEYLFYLYYLLILGIYIYGIVGIVSIAYPIAASRLQYLAYLTVIIAVHAGAFGYILSVSLGSNPLIYLQNGVAGQYILGPVLQPSTFGVFLVFSIYAFLRSKPFFAIFLSTLATILHPTYLLATAILNLLYIVFTYKQQNSIKSPVIMGCFALVLTLPLLAYTYISFGPTSPAIWDKSQDILINERIPWHAIPQQWLGKAAYVQFLIVIVALYLVRKTELFPVLLWPGLAATGLTMIQLFSQSKALALLFPWRISAVVVPIATSLIAAQVACAVFAWFSRQLGKRRRTFELLIVAVLLTLALSGAVVTKLRFDQELRGDAVPMMDFVAQTKLPGQVYLIPTALLQFRLTTGAPIFVDFGSHPYKDSEVIEWWNRLRIATSFYEGGEDIVCKILKQLAAEYKVTHVVFTDGHPGGGCAFVQKEYSDNKYGVYRITAY